MNDIEKRAREILAAELNQFDAMQIRQGHTPARCVAALRAVIAALSAAPQVPDGWVLVPVEPTGGMSSAATDIEVGYPTWDGSKDSFTEGEAKAIWKAMLAAKPDPHA